MNALLSFIVSAEITSKEMLYYLIEHNSVIGTIGNDCYDREKESIA